MHWTQKPEHKERLRAMLARSQATRRKNTRARKKDPRYTTKKGTREFSRKMSEIRKAAWRQRKAAGLGREGSVAAPHDIASTNGHPHPIAGALGAFRFIKAGSHKLAKASVHQLAIVGARMQLAELERQCDTLRIFIKQAED